MSEDLQRLLSRTLGHAVQFRAGLDERPQRPEADYLSSLGAFSRPLPEIGETGEMVIDDLVARATPGIAALAGRRFFAWVMGASHPVGVAADWMTSIWGQNAANHVASPSSGAVEAVAQAWLLDLLHLPKTASIGFVTGATVANFVCLAAARGAVLRDAGWDVEADGLFGAPPITVLVGEAAHATVFSALQFLGLGYNRVVRVAADDEGRILPAALEAAIEGVEGPSIVILQAGQINSGAFDPFAQIVPIAKAKGAWVHVDGAFGLWALAAPGLSGLVAGLDGADSWATDGHKWLQTPYDSGFAIVRDAEAHRRSMTTAASYLPSAANEERDPSHYGPELSRRARGFAAYAMIRHLGRSGIAAMVERHCALARRMAERLAGEPGVSILNDVVLNQVAVRFGADRGAAEGDALTQRTISAIQQDGTCYAGGALWHGAWILRLSIIAHATTETDIDRSAEAILAAWRSVRG